VKKRKRAEKNNFTVSSVSVEYEKRKWGGQDSLQLHEGGAGGGKEGNFGGLPFCFRPKKSEETKKDKVHLGTGKEIEDLVGGKRKRVESICPETYGKSDGEWGKTHSKGLRNHQEKADRRKGVEAYYFSTKNKGQGKKEMLLVIEGV